MNLERKQNDDSSRSNVGAGSQVNGIETSSSNNTLSSIERQSTTTRSDGIIDLIEISDSPPQTKKRLSPTDTNNGAEERLAKRPRINSESDNGITLTEVSSTLNDSPPLFRIRKNEEVRKLIDKHTDVLKHLRITIQGSFVISNSQIKRLIENNGGTPTGHVSLKMQLHMCITNKKKLSSNLTKNLWLNKAIGWRLPMVDEHFLYDSIDDGKIADIRKYLLVDNDPILPDFELLKIKDDYIEPPPTFLPDSEEESSENEPYSMNDDVVDLISYEKLEVDSTENDNTLTEKEPIISTITLPKVENFYTTTKDQATLAKHFAKLIPSRNSNGRPLFCNVNFQVDRNEYAACAALFAAQCDFFHRLIQREVLKNSSSVVTIVLKDIEADVFENILDFIMLASMPNLKDLIIATKIYDYAANIHFDNCRKYVLHFLETNGKLASISDLVELTQLYDRMQQVYEDSKSNAINNLLRWIESVVVTDITPVFRSRQLYSLSASTIMKLLELGSSSLSEIDIFTITLFWVAEYLIKTKKLSAAATPNSTHILFSSLDQNKGIIFSTSHCYYRNDRTVLGSFDNSAFRNVASQFFPYIRFEYLAPECTFKYLNPSNLFLPEEIVKIGVAQYNRQASYLIPFTDETGVRPPRCEGNLDENYALAVRNFLAFTSISDDDTSVDREKVAREHTIDDLINGALGAVEANGEKSTPQKTSQVKQQTQPATPIIRKSISIESPSIKPNPPAVKARVPNNWPSIFGPEGESKSSTGLRVWNQYETVHKSDIHAKTRKNMKVFWFLGTRWRVNIQTKQEDPQTLSIFLYNCDIETHARLQDPIIAKITFFVRDKFKHAPIVQHFEKRWWDEKAWGFATFAKIPDLLNPTNNFIDPKDETITFGVSITEIPH